MGRNSKHKFDAFRKRSREAGKSHYGEGNDEDQVETNKRSGSFPLDALKETEEYKKRIEIGGPKRKYAICFGYLGTQYQGLQINPDCKSIEAELEKALFLAGGFGECNYGSLQKLQWSRAARTDRGVHALAQCCAMKLLIKTDVPGRLSFIRDVNFLLPSDIRVHAITKVTKGFNSKLACSGRRYHYLLPTYMLEDCARIATLLLERFTIQGAVTDCAQIGGYAEPGATDFLRADHLMAVRLQLVSYRCSAEKLDLLRRVLGSYQGTKSFHNYTVGKPASDASATRYITSFTCSEPFLDPAGELEWVLLSVEGQSFLLNQIRKMVAMAADVARGNVTMEGLAKSFTAEKLDIPMAPGLGLYLDELFFEQYNQRQGEERVGKERLLAAQRAKASRASWASGRGSGASGKGGAAGGGAAGGGASGLDTKVGKHTVIEDDADDGNADTDAAMVTVAAEGVVEGAIKESGAVAAVAAVTTALLPTGEDDADDDEGAVVKKTRVVAVESSNSTPSPTVVGDETAVALVAQVEVVVEVVEGEAVGAMEVNSTVEAVDGATEKRETGVEGEEEVEMTMIGMSAERVSEKVAGKAAEEAAVKDRVAKDEVDDDETEVVCGEEIHWGREESTKEAMEAFKRGTLWPHIHEQESAGLDFLYFLDFLRVRNKLT